MKAMTSSKTSKARGCLKAKLIRTINKEETKHVSEVEHKSDISPQEHQYMYNQSWNQANMDAINNYYRQTKINDPYMMLPKQEEKNRMNETDHHAEQREHKTVFQNIGYIKDIK